MNTLVLEENEMGMEMPVEMPVDVYQKLADDRILFITGDLSDEVSTDIVAALLLKDQENPDEKITIFINSSGGDIRNAFMIIDMMNMATAPIETICIGAAMNEAALILTSGEPGMRYATKNSLIGISQLHYDYMAHGDLVDAKKLLEMSAVDNKRIIATISSTTGKTKAEVENDIDRKLFMTSAKALNYGLIDKVVGSK